MDPNLLQWKTLGQSFVQRLHTWFQVLDPSLLFSSHAQIQKAHEALAAGEQLNEKEKAAVILSLSSVHSDSGEVLPLAFRPPAYFPVIGPLVVGNFIPGLSIHQTLCYQFMLQTYNASFSFINRNSSGEQEVSLKHLLLISGTIFNTTVAGALPRVSIIKLGISSPVVLSFCRSVLPVPLSAALAALSVFTVRSEETQTGIQVFDQQGNPVGLSRAAGEQAVRETVLSRAALFGTTAAVPNLLMSLLRRTRLFRVSPVLVAPCQYGITALVLGLMVPVSFSLFPQLGMIERENLEEELKANAAGSHFYFHRGL
ncbi:sideroflexin-4 [Austrofundulus limnaeus]|uniref:Sideroflexin-4 n=1 Tax=Austrofundulus limnaeus TaxID=52670 RepID=A0A2I4AHX4_AUSLI|nr:PREDICTED: sideroflexin-4-like [Austrofundulus limnaeus]XP_013875348.1 PREDICTED: sideroflexin-4 [Austrofundulus limnaeus]